MGSCKGAGPAGEHALGLLASAKKTSHSHGNPANDASFPGSSSSTSQTTSPLLISEEGGRQFQQEQAARFQSADRLVFGQPPSREEAKDAVASILLTFAGSPLPQDPSQQQLNSEDSTQSRVLYALYLLRTSPSVERAAVSLASDSSVWDAVMRNESVQELRASLTSGERTRRFALEDVKGTSFSDLLAQALNWVFELTKPKIVEFALKIVKILEELLSSALSGKGEDHQLGILEDALRSSFMLSMLVSIVVVMARIHKVFVLTVV